MLFAIQNVKYSEEISQIIVKKIEKDVIDPLKICKLKTFLYLISDILCNGVKVLKAWIYLQNFEELLTDLMQTLNKKAIQNADIGILAKK